MKGQHFINAYLRALDVQYLVRACSQRQDKLHKKAAWINPEGSSLELNYKAKSQADLIQSDPAQIRLDVRNQYDLALRRAAPNRAFVELYEQTIFGTSQHAWALIGWYCIKHLPKEQDRDELHKVFLEARDLILAYSDAARARAELGNFGFSLVRNQPEKANPRMLQTLFFIAVWFQEGLLSLVDFELCYRNIKNNLIKSKQHKT